MGAAQHHVVGHHARQHIQIGRQCGNAGHVVHAVLQREDGGARRAGGRQFACGRLCGATFDTQQDDAVSPRRGVGQRVHPRQSSCGHLAVKAVEVAHPQAVRLQRRQCVGAPHQADGLAVGRQAPAHVATNGACAQNDEVHGGRT